MKESPRNTKRAPLLPLPVEGAFDRIAVDVLAIGDYPFYCLYGHEPRLPVDVKFLPPAADDLSTSVLDHRKRIVEKDKDRYCSNITSEAGLLNHIQPSKYGEIPDKKSLCRMCNRCFSSDSAWKYVTKEDEEVLQSADHPHLWKPPQKQRASEVRAAYGRLRYSQDQTEQSELGSSKQNKRKRMSPFEISQIIMENGITTRTELLAFADEQSGEGKTDIAEFVVNRGSQVVAEVPQKAWELKSAKENLERSRKSRLDILPAASAGDCICDCNGLWYCCAHQTLQRNGIEKPAITKAVKDLLDKGRSKYRNIFIVCSANCGKTFTLNPLNKVFATFSNPATTTFAWVGAEHAGCIFLNDFRWSAQVIPWCDLLLMLEGQPVHLPAPKTHYAMDLIFDQDTPIFTTGKHTLVYIKNGIIDERDTEMMSVRWKVFHFNAEIEQSEQ
ncbi:hypothetical protein P5673_014165 [Acropora cervicornis]|uniref:Uncharacterized protein n=1 Tax=Acropora cervicornis TaxID=6130 RepID=A0AAD9QJM3_ACRCE|nr:hypothetical protein P5673_014165 [Acropora cervicornis]